MSDGIHCVQCGELITRPAPAAFRNLYCTEHEQQLQVAFVNATAAENQFRDAELCRQEASIRHQLHQMCGALPFTWPTENAHDASLATLIAYMQGMAKCP